ncbi:family 10 glycosylhydrolase [Metabacillus idriensis]|uniref:family 10 glycosylhydrolase n=1 Tax=Metabacillus idriensis TaxID=324768 RepID=UPI002812A078|nr:family 10 glycosylhydrolase [Metabacillus idriensis]MDR0139611.1 family 10 glycosylhydrolase [Metabacillus idriensis]
MQKKMRGISSSILASTLVLSSFGMVGKASVKENSISVDVLTVKDQSGDHMTVGGINQLANEDKLVLFNDTFSYYTETKKGSKEIILDKIGLNTYQVQKHTDGDSPIPLNGIVLSTGAKTTAEVETFLMQLETGETVTLLEPVEKKEEKLANAINPTAESNPAGAPFDGFRGPDQLIVYNRSFGETTKTNAYGYEITVEDGFVTKLGGGGSRIPENGYVVSGHGIAAKWLSSHSIIGAKVTVDGNGTVKIIQDVDSFAFQSKQAIHQARTSIETAKANFLDVSLEQAENSIYKAEKRLSEAEALKEKDPVLALDVTRQATQLAYDAYYYSMPSNVAEQRAIWYRPEETTLEGVKQVLDRMEEAGFNSVYLETTFHGYTIYPSKIMEQYGLPAQHPRFENGEYGPYGKDLLDAYVKEGKKRGLTVQAWTDGFMVGESSLGTPPQFKIYPEWAATQRQNTTGKPVPDSSSKYYWLDIAQPDVQKFMLDIYKEMQMNYGIKGLNIDYMRYPHHDFEKSYGFSSKTRTLYKEETGIDPYTLNPSTNPEEWEKWTTWLRVKENEFVEKLHDQSKAINQKFMMTATPEPGPEAVLISDWKDDIDGVIPQAYGHDFNSIQKTVQDSKKLMPNGTMYYTGIYSFYHHLSEMASVNDVISAKHGTSGVNMFAFGQASAPSVDALGKGPWREKAVNPGEEPIKAAHVVLKEMETQISKIYIEQGAIYKKEGKDLKQSINELNNILKRNPTQMEKEINSVLQEVDNLIEKNRLESIVGERMKEQLAEVKGWVDYSLNHQKK